MTQADNARQIWEYFITRGWTREAVAGMLGNIQSESEIDPNAWQSGETGNMSVGYGLVQWTPATKYIDWAKTNGLPYADIFSQCKRIEWEVANEQQFSNSNMTFAQYTKSSESPEYLADVFIRSYERPLNPEQPARQTQARYWYNYLNGLAPLVKVVDWFNKHRGTITYSMDGSRSGADGTADCSGSMTVAVYEATGISYDYLYSTVTLGSYLEKCGYNRILTGGSNGSNLNQLVDEDIILLSKTNSMAGSGREGGHTGVISGGGKNITSTCYATEGQANTAIQDFPFNTNYLKADGFNYYEVWRKVSNNTSNGQNFTDNVYYGLHVLGGEWLGEITNFNNLDSNGFAGLPFSSHDLLYIKVDDGDIRYRVHTIESGWLSWVSQGNPKDLVNGCAGNPGETIDGVQIYYTTEGPEVVFQSYYRSQTTQLSGWLGVCCDDGTSIPGFDGWAGIFGEPLDRLQIGISYMNPF